MQDLQEPGGLDIVISDLQAQVTSDCGGHHQSLIPVFITGTVFVLTKRAMTWAQERNKNEEYKNEPHTPMLSLQEQRSCSRAHNSLENMAFGTRKQKRTPILGSNEPIIGNRRAKRTGKQPVINTSTNNRGNALSGLFSGRRNRGPAKSKPVVSVNTNTRRPSLGQRLNGLKKKIVGAVTRDRRMEAAGEREMHGRRSLFGRPRRGI